jgi:hypothetical protein
MPYPTLAYTSPDETVMLTKSNFFNVLAHSCFREAGKFVHRAHDGRRLQMIGAPGLTRTPGNLDYRQIFIGFFSIDVEENQLWDGSKGLRPD